MHSVVHFYYAASYSDYNSSKACLSLYNHVGRTKVVLGAHLLLEPQLFLFSLLFFFP